jgi:hypothetical protein
MRESWSSVSNVFFCRSCSFLRLVHDCPDAGTYCRGSYIALDFMFDCEGKVLLWYDVHRRCDNSQGVVRVEHRIVCRKFRILLGH